MAGGLRYVCACFVLAALALHSRPLGANLDSTAPQADQTIELEDPVSAPEFSRNALPPYRATYGRTTLYLPPFFHATDGRYDLLVHFHGMSRIQEDNVLLAHLNAAVVTVNVGMGSGPYEDAFRDPYVFAHLVAYSAQLVGKSGRARGARLDRVAVSAWSAGYGAVASILRQPQNVSRLDAVLLADGPHSDWQDEKRHVVADDPLAKYVRIAEAAVRGEKLFAITHSAIPTEGYPSSTETVGELLKLVSLGKSPRDAIGPRGMHQLYEADRVDLHVKGYAGVAVRDHIDHIRAMGETLLPYLRDRWNPPLSGAK
jgi:hypothetical protein